MSVEQILIMAFGFPTIALLTGIFFKIGRFEAISEDHSKQIARLWSAINDLRKGQADEKAATKPQSSGLITG